MAFAASSRGRIEKLQLQALSSNKYRERETSPERTKVWTEPSPKLKLNGNGGRRPIPVPVVYYLSRNGQLEHPHFMEVPLSSSQGLFLKDVIVRLNLLRGTGMANQYSWSAKRSYKNGYVWHDLEENDFIHPVHGQEYVLKGSEINLDSSSSTSLISKSSETTSSSSSIPVNKSDDVEPDFPIRSRRRNQSWTSIDLHEYKIYKAESCSGKEAAAAAAADAFTQTDDKRRRQRQEIKEEEEEEELSREEISPPPSDSSPETLESLMKADGRPVLSSVQTADLDADRTAGEQVNGGGKMRPSSVLMSLISCGSISFRDCGAAAVKDHGLSLVSHYKGRLPRGEDQSVEEGEKCRFGKIGVEDKEYFSGSLVETRKDQIPAFKRSSSYNADRASHLKVDEIESEDDGVRAKCIPRRGKAANPLQPRKESRGEIVDKDGNNNVDD